MKFKISNMFGESTHYSRSNGYTFKILSKGEKYYACVQNLNDKSELSKPDCRIPTYVTAWKNIYFDTIEEAKLWCEDYLQQRLEVKK